MSVFARKVNVNAVVGNTNDIVQDYALVISSGEGDITNAFTLASLATTQRQAREVAIESRSFSKSAGFTGLRLAYTVVPKALQGRTADGRRMLVTHGDAFDSITRHFRRLAMAGDAAYQMLMRSNGLINAFRARRGLPYWSASAFAKHQVKRAVNFV